MRRLEWTAFLLVLLTVVGIPVVILAYQFIYYPAVASASGEITIIARTHEAGGWLPSEIVVRRGEKVRLKVTSADVTHGLRIRGLKVKSGPITPGSYQIIEFVPQKTGTFPFYCTVICSPEHTEMQGEVIVEP
ncbi:MAG: cupredoxin domain-containing protein [Armatimonadota bacterium]|nr:cupredoxin domain-containing protein [Armatimonadota bacterium]MDR5702258.1 cupredoxin domain-containing protein [Armatimonadota bacterium]MDR7434554.1 cupredoxin domain-containing protein [Armatimonadota bacterium]